MCEYALRQRISASVAALSGDDQSIADLYIGVSRRAGRELDRRERAPRAGDSAGADGRSHMDDAALTIGEDDVDGEAHAERVDGLTGRDDQCGPLGETVASEQSAAPRLRIEGAFETRGERPSAAFVPQHQLASAVDGRLEHGRQKVSGHLVVQLARYWPRRIVMASTRVARRTGR